MQKKLEINRTKIKGSCQSGRKVATQDSKSDLPLVQSSLLLATESGAARPGRERWRRRRRFGAAAAWRGCWQNHYICTTRVVSVARRRRGALAIIIFKREEKGGPDWLAVAS